MSSLQLFVILLVQKLALDTVAFVHSEVNYFAALVTLVVLDLNTK